MKKNLKNILSFSNDKTDAETILRASPGRRSFFLLQFQRLFLIRGNFLSLTGEFGIHTANHIGENVIRK